MVSQSVQEKKAISYEERTKELETKVAKLEKELIAAQSEIQRLTKSKL